MGDPRLLRTAQVVSKFGTEELLELIKDLKDTMKHANGAGLAAPQIGVDLQVVIFGSTEKNPRYPNRPIVPPTILINPTITPIGEKIGKGVFPFLDCGAKYRAICASDTKALTRME